MKSKIKKFYLLVATGILLIILIFIGYRLLPESSPIAIAGNYIRDKQCNECHTQGKRQVVENLTVHNKIEFNREYLLAYFQAVRINHNLQRRLQVSNNTLIRGEQLVDKYHCFACHGLYGQGGQENAGSLKGYIPGWFGEDFDLLTNSGDPSAIRDWIEKGVNETLIHQPIIGKIAEYYMNKQQIKMLKFSGIPKEEINLLVAYVKSIRDYGSMDSDALLAYEKATLKQ